MKKAFTCTTIKPIGKCIRCRIPLDPPKNILLKPIKLCQLCIDKRNISLVKYNK